MTTYRFGSVGCTHLGYATKGMRMHSSGRNLRVLDGYLAYDEVLAQMLDQGCRGLWHGGDLFHWHRPMPRDIEAAHRIDDRRFAAGLWAGVNTGNHDAGAGADLSAVAVLDRPAMNSLAVYTHSRAKRVGPQPGLYEIHRPDPDIPLYLHVVSHFGLDPALRESGISIDPRPLDGGVNILCSHGIFVGEERLYKAVERHGAERLIPIEWVTRGWDLTLLSDYHTPGRVEGFGSADGFGQVWYTGSTVRRGFSDDESPRGWLRIDISDREAPQVSLQTIWQRPQRDFAPIDARGRTVAQINNLVHTRLAAQRWFDADSAARTGDGGWILRQRITDTTPSQRQELHELQGRWAQAASESAYWRVVFDSTHTTASNDIPGQRQGSIADRVTDFSQALTDRQGRGNLAKVLAAAPERLRADALRRAHAALGAPSEK